MSEVLAMIVPKSGVIVACDMLTCVLHYHPASTAGIALADAWSSSVVSRKNNNANKSVPPDSAATGAPVVAVFGRECGNGGNVKDSSERASIESILMGYLRCGVLANACGPSECAGTEEVPFTYLPPPAQADQRFLAVFTALACCIVLLAFRTFSLTLGVSYD